MGSKASFTVAYELGFSNVFIEIDSKLVVDGMVGKPSHRTECSSILYACKTILFSLPNFWISFI